ncbi:hypothetical protein P5706_07530 [Pseudomonas sp. ChxA]|uniref:hypothetical protein n=1 Tax=Pseudomonas sp. ChxA TaxID=3035473 RepID=UPI00255602CF|nr:hypothetical protein [Pseudomonas sp. ChxA]MDL2184032.1 hypothetical protein [Pseudomonas sp. ChxA]
MLTIPPLRFVLQDRTQPIPNLKTSLIVGDVVELLCDFAVQRLDFVNVYMISSVVGGSYNLSFEVGHDAPSIKIYFPKDVVVANSGNNVQLLLRLRRGMSYPAPDATISIDAGGIVVPVPGTVWDFADGTFQGWVPQSVYVGGVLHVVNHSVTVDLPSSQVTRAHIITRPVSVVAGRTYDFSFEVHGGTATGDGSTLYLTVNGSRIGANVQNITNTSTQTGTGTFTAGSTGTVHLGIFNETIPSRNHLLFLGNIRMTRKP